jgi:nucleoside-diphosphate-sugar epimerase
VVPTLITQILSGARKLRLGDLRPTRDFSFVTDTCRGLIILAECEAALGQVLNIGSNSEISIGELASLIKRLMGADTDVALEPERLRPATSEVFRLRCDNSRIRRLAGYAPQVLLEEGLRLTIEWLRRPENLARYKPELYNV